MRFLIPGMNRFGRCATIVALYVLVCQGVASAQNGTWIQTSDGQWEAPGSWSGNTIADGADNTADFSTLDIVDQGNPFYRVGIGMTDPRTIGHIIFGDANTGSPGAWEVYVNSGTPVITLAGTTPSITVNPLGPIDTGTPPLIDDAAVRVGLAGTSGLTKLGSGVLTLAGEGNTINGGINVSAGTLRVQGPLPNVPGVLPLQSYSLAGGATLETVAIGGVNTDPLTNAGSIAAGETATLKMTTAGTMLPWSGAGSTLNFKLGDTGLHELRGDWAANGALAQVNFSTDSALGARRSGPARRQSEHQRFQWKLICHVGR